MLAEKNDTIKKAVEKLVYVSAEEKLRFEYEQRKKAIMDYYSDMDDARQEGIEIGEERGNLKGNLKGKKNTIIKLLTKKLGVMPHEIREMLDKASEEKLDVIVENVFEVESIEDVEKLL